MSLVGTLAKVAMGAMIAKGVSGAMSGGGAGGAGGGLGGLLGGLTGGGAGGAAGGLGGLAGGLGGLLGGQQQGGQQQQAGVQQQGQAGGLGGLLEQLGGGADAQAGQAPAQGGFGDLFNTALAGGEAQPDPAAELQAEVLLRATLMAARADGVIDADEQAKITGNLGEMSDDEANFIRTEMANPTSLEAFIPTIPAGMEQQVYLMSLMAIDLDTQEEAQYLDQLAKGLNIDNATSNAIHAKLGVPALYG